MGLRGSGSRPRRDAGDGRAPRRALRTGHRDDRPASASPTSTCAHRAWMCRWPSPSGARPPRSTGPGTRTASRTGTSCAPSTATSPTRPTSSPSRRPRPTSSPCSTGARRTRSPRSPTAAARPSSAGWSAPSMTVRRRRLDRPRRASTGCSRSIPSRRAARIQAGALGPVLEEQLRPHGYTLRHFPQSFEFSTLGGWLATRSGGHYASVYTHIDDLVESMRVVTPTGVSESRRLPRLGRRAITRPPVPRLGGRARGSSPRRGCASRSGHGGRASAGVVLRRLRRRSGGDQGGRPVRPVPHELPAARRPARRRRRPERRTSARCSSSASSRPTIPSARGSTGPSSCVATTAARFRPASAPPTAPTARHGSATMPSGRGVRRSYGRRTCATPWSVAGCCSRRSRRPARGTPSTSSTAP